VFDCEVTMGRAGGGVKGEGGVLELDEDGCERIYTDIDYGPFNNDGMGTDQICLTWTCHIGIIFERRAVGIKLTTRMAISTTILSLSPIPIPSPHPFLPLYLAPLHFSRTRLSLRNFLRYCALIN